MFWKIRNPSRKTRRTQEEDKRKTRGRQEEEGTERRSKT